MNNGEMYLYYAIGVFAIVCFTLIFLALNFDTPEILHERQIRTCTACLCMLGFTPQCVQREKKVTIPLIFTKKFKKYNSLQKEAGLDLTKWRGLRVEVYRCELAERTDENEPMTASIYMVGDTVIAGDICAGDKILPLCIEENMSENILR